jgi:hypothetical protein
MGAVTDLASALQQYGAWALCAVLMFVVGFLARHIITLNSERLKDQKEINEEMLQLVEKRVEADLSHAAAFVSLKEVVQRLIEKL